MDKNLYYLTREPKVILEKNPAILLLHGYGSNEEDLFSFAGELPENYYIFSARAPITLPPFGYAWFDIQWDMYGNKTTNDAQAKEAQAIIIDFIEELKTKYPIDPQQFNLIGFSQGAILSYAIAFTKPNLVNKVIALSGYFKREMLTEYLPNDQYAKLKFFVSHGTSDQVIPISDARETKNILNDLGINYIYKEYPVGHGVAPQNFYDVLKFIND